MEDVHLYIVTRALTERSLYEGRAGRVGGGGKREGGGREGKWREREGGEGREGGKKGGFGVH